MQTNLKSFVRKFLHIFSLAIVPYQIYERNRINPQFLILSRWFSISANSALSNFILKEFWQSKAQLQQDLVALYIYQRISLELENHGGGGALQKNNAHAKGFFVEFGATNGVTLSNTYLLETNFGWSGVLAEPAVAWHEELLRNRTCKVDKRCVFSTTGEIVSFAETEALELSTIEDFSKSDIHAKSRINSRKYMVETVSLEDLFLQHNVPRTIDYLSVDTEGSEIEIIRNFDFSSWDIRFITIETTSLEKLSEISEILYAHNYRRILDEHSEWEGWFLSKKYLVMESF